MRNTTTHEADLIGSRYRREKLGGHEALYALRNARYILVNSTSFFPPTVLEIDAEDAWAWLRENGFHAEAAELAEIGT